LPCFNISGDLDETPTNTKSLVELVDNK